MHYDDAYRKRVLPTLVEARFVDAIERQQSLTSGANGADGYAVSLSRHGYELQQHGST